MRSILRLAALLSLFVAAAVWPAMADSGFRTMDPQEQPAQTQEVQAPDPHSETCPKGIPGCSPDNRCDECDRDECGSYCQHTDPMNPTCGKGTCMSCPEDEVLVNRHEDGTGTCVGL